jgi:addiction module RelE/StbE family toxin
MGVQVGWSPLAVSDLQDLTAYIRADNPSAAAALATALIERIDRLQEFPEMGRMVPELPDSGIREIRLRPYRIIYRYSAAKMKVQVIRVWHGARGTPEILP